MLAIFLLMLDRLGLRLIPPHILGSELFAGLGLDGLRDSSPPWLLSFWSPDVCGGGIWRPLPRFAPIDRASCSRNEHWAVQKEEHYEQVVSLVLSCRDTNENFLLGCTSSNRRKELQLIETLTYLTSAKARSTKLSSSRATVTKNIVLQN